MVTQEMKAPLEDWIVAEMETELLWWNHKHVEHEKLSRTTAAHQSAAHRYVLLSLFSLLCGPVWTLGSEMKNLKAITAACSHVKKHILLYFWGFVENVVFQSGPVLDFVWTSETTWFSLFFSCSIVDLLCLRSSFQLFEPSPQHLHMVLSVKTLLQNSCASFYIADLIQDPVLTSHQIRTC